MPSVEDRAFLPVIGLFENAAEALQVAQELEVKGFRKWDLSVFMNQRQQAADLAAKLGAKLGYSSRAYEYLMGWVYGPSSSEAKTFGLATKKAAASFFANLVSAHLLTEQESRRCRECIEHGGVMLMVKAPAPRKGEVREVLGPAAIGLDDPGAIRADPVPTGGPTPQAPAPKKIFVSYCHKDAKLLDEFKLQLEPFFAGTPIFLWDDTHINPSEEWKRSILDELRDAFACILMVSVSFLNSDFVRKTELPVLLEGKKVFWVLLNHCGYRMFPEIEKRQALNEDLNRPICKMRPAERNEAFYRMAEKMVEVLGG